MTRRRKTKRATIGAKRRRTTTSTTTARMQERLASWSTIDCRRRRKPRRPRMRSQPRMATKLQ
eukprot:15684680-Heterocapsa_arctica.AAC.1